MASLKRLRRRPAAEPDASDAPVHPLVPASPQDALDDPSAPAYSDGPDPADPGVDSAARSGAGRVAGLRRTSSAVAAGSGRVAVGSARRTGTLIGGSLPWLLMRAAHPRQGLLTAFGVATLAAFVDRPAREIVVVFLTVLVGQTVLGWHNDLIDRERDTRHTAEGRMTGKPLAEGRLDPGTVWFALACGVLLLVPLAISTGVTAGSCYLLAVGIGVLGHYVLRRGRLSWVSWAASYALLPAYVAFGGWGGSAEGQPPEVAITLLAAALGVGVHTLRSLFGLVADHQDGWTYWPLRLSLRLGATRMLVLTVAYLAVVTAAMVIVGASVGLRQ